MKSSVNGETTHCVRLCLFDRTQDVIPDLDEALVRNTRPQHISTLRKVGETLRRGFAKLLDFDGRAVSSWPTLLFPIACSAPIQYLSLAQCVEIEILQPKK